MSKPSVLVTGATGNTGGATLKALVANNATTVSALSRDINKLTAIDGVTNKQGDFADAASMAKALEGVTRAFLVSSPGTFAQTEAEINFLKAAATAGLEAVVRISTCNPLISKETKGVYAKCHAEIEQYIADNKLPVIDLNPDWFMENQYLNAPEAKATGKISNPCKDLSVKYGFICNEDIGGMAAALLAAPLAELTPLFGKRMELHGPSTHSFDEFTALISKHAGYPIENQSVPPEGFTAALVSVGLTELFASSFTLTFTTMAGEATRYRPYVTATDPALLKFYTPKVTVAQFAEKVAQAFKK